MTHSLLSISNFYIIIFFFFTFLIAQLVKNPSAMQETRFNSWVGKIQWRRDRLPTPVFLGFPGGSADKESTCNVSWETWVGKIPWRRERQPTTVFWPGEFHGLHSPRGPKELDTIERLSLFFCLLKHFYMTIYISPPITFQRKVSSSEYPSFFNINFQF